jgi:glycerol-3-phosphate dehydrogenase
MNIALIMTAVTLGAVVANYCEVTQLHKDSTGKLNGARVRDNLTGEEWNVRAKVCSLMFSSAKTQLCMQLGYH